MFWFGKAYLCISSNHTPGLSLAYKKKIPLSLDLITKHNMLVLRVLIDNICMCEVFELLEEGITSHIIHKVAILEICLSLCLIHAMVDLGNLTADYA